MTIENANLRQQHSVVDLQADYGFNFKILKQTDLKVVLSTSAGVDTVKTLTTHYTVSGVGSQNGGTVTFTAGNIPATSSSAKVTLILDTELKQAMDLSYAVAIDSEALEGALDNSININKRSRDLVDRSLKLPDGDVDGSGAYDAKSNRIKNLGTPTAASDAATKTYTDVLVNNTALGPAPTGLIATGSVTSRLLADRWGEVKNVKDFGATGDGVTDDAVAINAALAAAKANARSVVTFPPGTYIVSAPLNPGTGTTVSGYGAHLFLTNGVNNHVIRVDTDATDVNIMGISIDGNKANQSGGAGIAVVGSVGYSDRIVIQDCRVVDTEDPGILIIKGRETKILNNFVSDTNSTGIQCQGGTEKTVITGNHVVNTFAGNISIGGVATYVTVSSNVCDTAGIFGDGIVGYDELNYGLTVTGNVCRNGSNHGIHVGGSGKLVVADNIIENPVNSGVFLGNSNHSYSLIDGFSVTGNVIHDATSGIYVRGCQRGTVSGNAVDSGTTGLQLTDITQCAVVGNTSVNNTVHGIRNAGVSNSTITGNVCSGNGEAGLTIQAGTGESHHNVISGNNVRDNTGQGLAFLNSENNNYAQGNFILGNTPNLTAPAATTDATLNFTDTAGIRSVAAAASITLPTHGNAILVTDTGTTTINTIVASFVGRVVTLVFPLTATVVGDGTGNVLLAGTFTASGTANDTLTLLCNGTIWFEVSRSAN